MYNYLRKHITEGFFLVFLYKHKEKKTKPETKQNKNHSPTIKEVVWYIFYGIN